MSGRDPRDYQIAVLGLLLAYGLGWLDFDLGGPARSSRSFRRACLRNISARASGISSSSSPRAPSFLACRSACCFGRAA